MCVCVSVGAHFLHVSLSVFPFPPLPLSLSLSLSLPLSVSLPHSLEMLEKNDVPVIPEGYPLVVAMTALMDAVKSVSLVITDEVKAKKHVAQFLRRSPSPGQTLIRAYTVPTLSIIIHVQY